MIERIADKNTARIGSTLTILYNGDPIEDAIDITIAGWGKSDSDKATAATLVSHDTPIAIAVIGKKSGERATFEAPNGTIVGIKIIAVH